ncbi:MAG: hypothetical protein HUU56_01245 [Bdellovibrionaceae bacterium]|nr:hypothetical protein [Pseudobdellovibrionaceae bacterium]
MIVVYSFSLICSLLASGIIARVLALREVSYEESLFFKGLSCLGLILFFAFKNNISLIPKNYKLQFVRFLLAGTSLGLFTLSYNYLSATGVATLSNIDIPVILLLGFFWGTRASKKTVLASVTTIALVIILAFLSEATSQENQIKGSILVIFSSLLICLGYFLINESMKLENELMVILTPTLGIIVYALVIRFSDSTIPATSVVLAMFSAINTPNAEVFQNILLFSASGASMFGAYIFTMKLYQLLDISLAEFPTLLSTLLIQPVEYFLIGEKFNLSYFLITLIIIVFVLILLKINTQEQERL